jgi:hypothetical protein
MTFQRNLSVVIKLCRNVLGKLYLENLQVRSVTASDNLLAIDE